MKISTLLLYITYKNGGTISTIEINKWLNKLLELGYLEKEGFKLKLTNKSLNLLNKQN